MIKSNALVLLIGISNYKNIASLPGVKEDINQYRKLWNNHYKYTIFPTTTDKKWYNKWKWTASEIETCIEEGRELLFDENDNALHDSLIIVICGHGGKSKGGEGVIIPSDYISKNKSKVLTIQQLHNKVSGAWLIDVVHIERLFIIDCCRGKQYNGSIKRGKGTINEQTNLCTLYGNSPGLCVSENIEGGLFSQSLIKYFKDNISQKYTLSILTRLANIYLKKKSNEEQTIWKEGDGNMDFVIFIAYNECHNENMQHVHTESDMELESEEFFIVTNIEKENNKYHYNNKELFITEEKIETEKQQISESVQEAKDDAKDDINNDNNIFYKNDNNNMILENRMNLFNKRGDIENKLKWITNCDANKQYKNAKNDLKKL
eukprot:314898_1